MQWNDKYKINVNFLDDQHQEWFSRVADFQAAINQEQMIAEMARTLKFVVDYAQKHLSDEERYMREINYPKMNSHRQLHKVFMKKTVSVLTDMKNGKRVIPSQLLEFMATWIGQHILEHDRQIGEYLATQQDDDATEKQAPVKIDGDPLTTKLKELSALLKSKLITQEDHATKTKELLTHFASNALSQDSVSALENIDKLSLLHKQGMISDEGLEVAKALLAENLNIDQALEPYDMPKAKMQALNTLLENNLITAEQHGEHKSLILSGI